MSNSQDISSPADAPHLRKWKEKDVCWITVLTVDEEGIPEFVRMRGTVLFAFTYNGYIGDQYVIAVDDSDYPQMEVRDALRMSETESALHNFEGTVHVRRPHVYGGGRLS